MRATDDDFTDRASRHLLVLSINDTNFYANAGQTGRIHLAVGLMFGGVMFCTEGRGHRGQFGHAITLGETGTGE
ncbi:hypothetical protein D3C81_1873920 [compost metagenome]